MGGPAVDMNHKVSELRTKIAQRVAEGGIAKNRTDLLDRSLAGG